MSQNEGYMTALLSGALSLIKDDAEGTYASGKFEELMVSAHVTRPPGVAVGHLRAAHNDLWDLQAIALKMRWLTDRRDAGDLDEYRWMFFCTSDILAFHVELRSLFDALAGFVASVADKKGVVPDSSFEGLQKWLEKPVNEAHLGVQLAQAIRSCDWFADLRTVREELVHREAETIAFPQQGRILFQIHQGASQRILIPEVMYNENIADFELYAGLLFGRLLMFLEALATATFKTSKIEVIDGGPAKSYHPGLVTIRGWIQTVMGLPQEQGLGKVRVCLVGDDGE
jgi:hypothetical protein